MLTLKRLASLALSFGVLAIIYQRIELGKTIEVFRHANWAWMAVSLIMLAPLLLITAWRLKLLVPGNTAIGFYEANSLILAASAMNMILPSKMGDIAKAYFIKQKGDLDGPISFSLVVFEKICDLFGLFFWCVPGLFFLHASDDFLLILAGVAAAGLLATIVLIATLKPVQRLFLFCRRFAPKKLSPKLQDLERSWSTLHFYVWGEKNLVLKILLVSIALWLMHLTQIWLFILALGAWAPFHASLVLSSFAILAGLLPFTFAGIGTRDAALILLYKPFLAAPTAAALGMLCTLRYLLPATIGAPFLGKYVAHPSGTKIEAAGRRPSGEE